METNTPAIQLKEPVSVRVEGVSKSFGDQTVLSDIAFDVTPGEIFVIMGPSGSGKSVLLKNIIGLELPDSGLIEIGGLDASCRETHRKILTSMVFQSGALFNSLTVFDNLAFYPREHELYSEVELKRRVNDVLDMLSLGDAAKKRPSELSGGMRKRVAIACTLMMEPQLILYDEPTSELDPIMATTIAEVIATLRKELGVTSIVVTHDTHVAESIADRVAVLMDGSIRLIASPAELKNVDDERVRDFLNPTVNLEHPRFKTGKNS